MRAREKGRCRGGSSMLIATGGEIGIQWRRGGFELPSLAVFRLGFSRGEVCGEDGVYMEGLAWIRGQGIGWIRYS
jgi:hypothetical protein